MSEQEKTYTFDQNAAASYDQRFAKLAPMRDALYLFMRIVFSNLRSDARILCVGAGTGLEIGYLAQAFPQWQFTAVDPSGPMLEVCRHRAEAEGFADRISFHEGYRDSLPTSEPYDAATCLLVTHFILDQDERRALFSQIAGRLRPQGTLINADLSYDTSAVTFDSLFDVWADMQAYAGGENHNTEQMRAAMAERIALLSPSELAALIESSGFDTPVLFFQCLFIHAWYSRASHRDELAP